MHHSPAQPILPLIWVRAHIVLPTDSLSSLLPSPLSEPQQRFLLQPWAEQPLLGKPV